MPADWAFHASRALRGHEYRVRAHPGQKSCKPLDDDLANASAVATWGSGAALKALLWGIPCFHGFRRWIGAGASTFLQDANPNAPQRPDRLETFRRVASAMWRVSEIESGEAFSQLLGLQ